MIPFGIPGARVSSFHVSPPSVERNNPLPAPPLDIFHGILYACHSVAKRILGLLGSITRSTAPVESLRKRILSHDFPPFRDLNTPLSGLGADGLPSAATYTRSGFVLSMPM